MRIKITENVPIDASHGVNIGREFDVIRFDKREHVRGDKDSYWIEGDTGEHVKIFDYECEVINE